MSGMELMLTNMLKAFMPKESAEKIAGWAQDGTFDRIGALPSELDEIKRAQARIEFGLARIFAVLQNETIDRVPGGSSPGFVQAALAEHRTDDGPGGRSSAGGDADNGCGSDLPAGDRIGDEVFE